MEFVASHGAGVNPVNGTLMVVTYYVIRDPDTKRVAYIGQTIHSDVRGKQHLNPVVSSADSSKGMMVAKWVKSLANQGKTPEFEVIGHIDFSSMSKPLARIVRSAIEKALIEGFADDAAISARHLLNVVHNPYRDRATACALVTFDASDGCVPIKTEKGFACASRHASLNARLATLTK